MSLLPTVVLRRAATLPSLCSSPQDLKDFAGLSTRGQIMQERSIFGKMVSSTLEKSSNSCSQNYNSCFDLHCKETTYSMSKINVVHESMTVEAVSRL